MKTKIQWTCCLACALALGMTAGCASDHEYHSSGNPGPGITYEQGGYGQPGYYGHSQPGGYYYGGDNTGGTWNGAPYENQHPMPRPQMTP